MLFDKNEEQSGRKSMFFSPIGFIDDITTMLISLQFIIPNVVSHVAAAIR
jgi:hypothetical protein